MSPWHKGRRRGYHNLLITAAIFTGVSIAYAVYRRLDSSNTDAQAKKNIKGKDVVIVISNSIIASSLSLKELLENNELLTFLVAPNSPHSISSFTNSHLVDGSISNYKLLDCSNTTGFYLIIKSLQPNILIVCPTDLNLEESTMNSEIGSYADEIIKVSLTQEFDSLIDSLRF